MTMGEEKYTTTADLHESSAGVIYAEWRIIERLYPEIYAALCKLMDRDEYLETYALGGGEFRVTTIGELQIKGTNKTGAASVVGTLLVPDTANSISGTGLATASAVTGIASTNSKAGKIYLSLFVAGGFGSVQVHSDLARTGLIAHGALGDNLGGTINLVADGGSGIGGTITVTAGLPAIAEVTGEIDAGVTGGYSKAGIDSASVVAVCGEVVAANASMWITIPGGVAQVLVENAQDLARSQWVRSGSTTAGRVQGDDASNPMRALQYIGRSIGRKEAGVGTTCGILFTGPQTALDVPALPSGASSYHLKVAAGPVPSWEAFPGNPATAGHYALDVTGGVASWTDHGIIKQATITVNFAVAADNFAALAGGVKTFTKTVLVTTAGMRLVGLALGEGTLNLFDDAAHGTYGLEIGTGGDPNLVLVSENIAVGGGFLKGNGTAAGVGGYRFADIASLTLQAVLTSDKDLNTVTAGEIKIDLFYMVV
jgi:hypothetical protein